MRSGVLWLAALTSVFGCARDPETSPTEQVDPVPPMPGDLLIEELYYSGAPPEGGADHYFSDQFVELVNASDVPLDLSGVRMGDAYGAAGPINPGTTPDSYVADRPQVVVLSSVWRIPDGTRLDPGETLVLAHDGTNHRPFSSVDLSGAAFETFVEGSPQDDDHLTVDNLEQVVFNGGYDWLVPVFGASIAILDAETELGTQDGPLGELATIPKSAVLDGVDALMDADSGDFKRLPDSVDSGFAWVSGTYVGESLHRRRAGDSWQDTDDSGADFVVGPPDPGRPPDPDGVFGDAWIELGTGTTGFETLSDGDPVELVAGIQGGWHVDVAVQFGGFGPAGIQLLYSAVDGDGQPVSFVTPALLSEAGLLDGGEEAWVRVGDRVVLDIQSQDEVVGEEIVLRVTAELADQIWSDERRVLVVDLE